MQTQCQIRVLIVDDDQTEIKSYKKILTHSGMQVKIAEGQGLKLYESAKNLAQSFRPHIVVMDYLLSGQGKKDSLTGLDLWQDVVFINSKANCILLSGYLDVPLTRDALKMKNIVDVVSKAEAVAKLLTSIHTHARINCHCQIKEAFIEWPAAWNEEYIIYTLFDGESNVRPDLVRDVLGRLFPNARTISLQNMGGEARSPGSIIRGRYVILQAQVDDQRKVVVKLATAARVEQENKCFRTFIENHIEGDFHAQLKSSQVFWDLGAVCYSFIGSPFHELKLFSDYYKETSQIDALVQPLQHLFKEVWSRHYFKKVPLENSLFEEYDKSFSLRQKIKEMPRKKIDVIAPGVRNPLQDPFRWVIRHEKDSRIPLAQQAITHGDLHGDNVFVDAEHAWVIDFERSGPGSILRDFVELEEDIITRLADIPNDPPDLFTGFVVDLLSQKSPQDYDIKASYSGHSAEAHKALQVLQRLRKLAVETTSFQDMREYYWGLLLDALFSALLVKQDSLNHNRILLLAAMICERLHTWDKPWPPPSWHLNKVI